MLNCIRSKIANSRRLYIVVDISVYYMSKNGET